MAAFLCRLSLLLAAAAILPAQAFAEAPLWSLESKRDFWTKSECDAPPEAPSVHVKFNGVRNDDGNIRLILYNANDEFLEGGKWLARVDLPAKEGDMEFCLPLPHEGRFAMAVLHDEDANGKYGVFSEGYGFPNNPRLMFGPPDPEEAAFTANGVPVELDIDANYLYDRGQSRSGPRRGPRGR